MSRFFHNVKRNEIVNSRFTYLFGSGHYAKHITWCQTLNYSELWQQLDLLVTMEMTQELRDFDGWETQHQCYMYMQSRQSVAAMAPCYLESISFLALYLFPRT